MVRVIEREELARICLEEMRLWPGCESVISVAVLAVLPATVNADLQAARVGKHCLPVTPWRGLRSRRSQTKRPPFEAASVAGRERSSEKSCAQIQAVRRAQNEYEQNCAAE